MARDERIRMRNGLIIPGVLLVFYGVLAILYAELFRPTSDFCADSNRILIAGLCYSVRNLIIPIVVIGVALIVTGYFVFRSPPKGAIGHLHHGTPTHVVLAILVSWVAASAVTLIVQLIRQGSGPVFELTILGARYEHAFLLELLLLVGLLILLPYLALYFSVGTRRRNYLEAVEAEANAPEPGPQDEPLAYVDSAKAAEAQAVDMVPDDEWPGERDSMATPTASTNTAPPAPFAAPSAPAAPATPAPAVVAAQDPAAKCPALRDGHLCNEPVHEGARFCARHGCHGLTKDGKRCRNQATSNNWCQIHVVAERQA